MDEMPHLSARCNVCGDKVSMPPVSSRHSIGKHKISLGYSDEVHVALYKCTNADCSGTVVGYYTYEKPHGWKLRHHVPKFKRYQVDESVPPRAQQLLQEANDAKNTPAACVMTASRAVEAMLAEKGYKDRKDSLKKRIDQAVEARLLPEIMGNMAHEIREFAREGHTDENPQELPDKDDAEHVLTYANTLADYLYVLPSRFQKVGEKDTADKGN